jgi:HEAT repeat protein
VKRGDLAGLIELAHAPDPRGAAAMDGILEVLDEHPELAHGSREAIRDAGVSRLRDLDDRTRAAAVSLVILTRDASAPTVAVNALDDPSPGVRTRGLIGVIFLEPPGCLRRVLELLDDENSNIRSLAAAALERVGDATSVATLSKARAREGDSQVRDRIDETVAILEGRRPPTPIEPSIWEVAE